MKGLDVTVLSLSEVRADNEKFRVDDGYFAKLPVLTQRLVEAMPHIRFGLVCSVFRKGIFDIKANTYAESGVPFVRIGDLRDGLIDSQDLKFITPAAHAAERKTALKFGDIVLSKTAYAAASFVNLPECNVSQDTIAVRLSTDGRKKFNSGYITAYLNSRYGLALLSRHFQGNVQLHLSLSDGRKVPIPVFGKIFQDATDKAIRTAHDRLKAAGLLVEKASDALVAAVGLADWKQPESLTYIRRASDTFARGRLDAEHYQEKYFALAARLRGYSGGCASLGELCPSPTNGVEIRKYVDDGVPYLRVGDLHYLTVSSDKVKRVAPSAAAAEIEKVKLMAGDVLVSRSGSLAVTAVVEPEWVHSVISSHLIRVRIGDADFRPLYVAAFLAAMPGKMQIIQNSNGGVQPEINQPSLKRVLIPRLKAIEQEKVISYIQQSRKARQQAWELLAHATRVVEIAIAESEAAALKYLEKS